MQAKSSTKEQKNLKEEGTDLMEETQNSEKRRVSDSLDDEKEKKGEYQDTAELGNSNYA